MIMIRIGRRGQITLPSPIRQQLDIQEGDNLILFTQQDQVILKPIRRTLLDLRGSIPAKGGDDLADIRKQAIQEHIRTRVEGKSTDEP